MSLSQLAVGQKVYILESQYHVRAALILKISGDLYTLKFLDSNGALRVRRKRIYKYPDEAHAAAERNIERCQQIGRQEGYF